MKLSSIFNDIITETSVKSSDRTKIYEDERLLVVVPLTHRASCKYGAHTPWCVSTPSNADHYEVSDNFGFLNRFKPSDKPINFLDRCISSFNEFILPRERISQ